MNLGPQRRSRIGRGRTPALVAVAAGVLGAGAATSTLPPAATATLVKGVPIVITTAGSGGPARSFTLTYRPRGFAPIRDRGSAVQTIASRRVERFAGEARRLIVGTELLESAQGMLALYWRGMQNMTTSGSWGRMSGRWSLVGATGAYLGRSGWGTFSAGAAFGAVEYRGLLITAR
jgi:hypothetical protein